MQTQRQPQVSPIHHDEQILVVSRASFFPHGAWQGLKQVDVAHYIELIKTHQEFKPRSVMEKDPNYKQIIPYLVFEYENNYFLMQRQAKASETRLQNKYSLGIGGHVRQEDLSDGATIFDWAQREFHEEVSYAGGMKITPLGILNDDSNEVGKVHVGLVLLVQGDSADIAVKSELKSGRLAPIDECLAWRRSRKLESDNSSTPA
jgi:predicted NUDIX family phosphoesterase